MTTAERTGLVTLCVVFVAVWIALIASRLAPGPGHTTQGPIALPLRSGSTLMFIPPHGWCQVHPLLWVPCGHPIVDLEIVPDPSGWALARIGTELQADRPMPYALFYQQAHTVFNLPLHAPASTDFTSLALEPKGQALAHTLSLLAIPAGGNATSTFMFGYTLTETHEAVLEGTFWLPGPQANGLILRVRWRETHITPQKIAVAKDLLQQLANTSKIEDTQATHRNQSLSSNTPPGCRLTQKAVERTMLPNTLPANVSQHSLAQTLTAWTEVPCPPPGHPVSSGRLHFSITTPEGPGSITPLFTPTSAMQLAAAFEQEPDTLSDAQRLHAAAHTLVPYNTAFDSPDLALCGPYGGMLMPTLHADPTLPAHTMRLCLRPDGGLGQMEQIQVGNVLEGTITDAPGRTSNR